MSVKALPGALVVGLALLAAPLVRAGEPLPTVRVAPGRMPLERYLDGTIEAVNQGTISAQTSGRVLEVLYDVNDFMPAGAVIVRLNATEQRAGLEQAQAALTEATTREAEAAKQFERIAELLERRLVSRQQYDQALAERDAAVARSAAARGALAAAREGVRYTEVRAPYAAVVARRHVEPGETVQPGTPLLSGLSLQYLRVNVDLPQGLVGSVRVIRRAAIHVDGRRIEATRLTLSPQAAPGTSTFRARLDLPENAADLYPGMLVKTSFVVGETKRLLIPAAALVARSELQSVYVLAGDGQVTLRQVRTGHRFDERIEVLAGLVPGELVVTDPLAALERLREPPQRPAGKDAAGR